MPKSVKHLGKKTDYKYSGADASLLDTFPSPFERTERKHAYESKGTVHIEAPEFTSLCPLTGQPDFATIVIDYCPNALCVESKSLKLYLGTFRMHGYFHEACVARIARDLLTLLHPRTLRVEGRFTPRGGIPFWPTVEYREQ